MPLTHIEHPEDTILTGDLSVLDAFTADNHYSVKIDGSPAIVWGTNPENGKFFVGTKSVFNKKTPKITTRLPTSKGITLTLNYNRFLFVAYTVYHKQTGYFKVTLSVSVVIVIINLTQFRIH